MARSTSIEIAQYLQYRVREAIQGGKTAAELAREAGVSNAQISELKNRGVGAGWQTAEGLAKAFGMTMPELLEAAKRWAEIHQKRSSVGSEAGGDQTKEVDARRELAAQLAEEDGVSPAAIRSVMGEPVSPENLGRSTIWWALQMRRRELDLLEVPGRTTADGQGEVLPVEDTEARRRAPTMRIRGKR
jgi:transcriptional regulator with XRE-family HTH domain